MTMACGQLLFCALQVTAHTGPEELSGALYGADLVVIPAGVPRKPGMTRDDLFNTNAGQHVCLCICGRKASATAAVRLHVVVQKVPAARQAACSLGSSV